MARPRKLIETKKLQGTYRNNQEPIKSPVVLPSAPSMPRPPEKYAKRMTRDALDYWAMVEPDLQAAGLFKMVDVASLIKWCTLSAEIDELQVYLQENGYSYETSNGYINERPEAKTFSRLLDQYNGMCRLYGFNPLARDAIRRPEVVPDDPISRMLDD